MDHKDDLERCRECGAALAPGQNLLCDECDSSVAAACVAKCQSLACEAECVGVSL